MPDDSEYLTVAEFAALSSPQQHAVWRAAYERQVGWVLASPGSPMSVRRYHRGQAAEILRRMETPR